MGISVSIFCVIVDHRSWWLFATKFDCISAIINMRSSTELKHGSFFSLPTIPIVIIIVFYSWYVILLTIVIIDVGRGEYNKNNRIFHTTSQGWHDSFISSITLNVASPLAFYKKMRCVFISNHHDWCGGKWKNIINVRKSLVFYKDMRCYCISNHH